MKLTALAAFAALLGIAATPCLTASASSVVSSAGPPCVPKTVKIHKQTAIVLCGPATATIKIGGKTYTFTGGYCKTDSRTKTTLILSLGTVMQSLPFEKSGRPNLLLTIAASPRRAAVSAIAKGHYLLPIGDGDVVVSGAIPGSGTFVDKSGPTFRGSWNCHGVIDRL